MLEAGMLRHRLQILEPTLEQDSDTGAVSISWDELDTVWGAFEFLSVKDYVAAGSTQEQLVARAVIRHRSDVLKSMRVVHRETTYEIKGPPLPDKESGFEYLTLMLSGVTND